LEHAVHERSITHILAEYLQREFPDYNVDCEYNKHGLDVKKLPRQCQGSNKDNIFPDITVHVRGDDDSNLLVVEAKPRVKCSVPECDAAKLVEVAKPDGKYRYRFGLFIGFNGLHSPNLSGTSVDMRRSFRDPAEHGHVLAYPFPCSTALLRGRAFVVVGDVDERDFARAIARLDRRAPIGGAEQAAPACLLADFLR